MRPTRVDSLPSHAARAQMSESAHLVDSAARSSALRLRAGELAAEVAAASANTQGRRADAERLAALATARRAEAQAFADRARASALFLSHASKGGILDRGGMRGLLEGMGLLAGPRELDAAMAVFASSGGGGITRTAFLDHFTSLAPAVAGVELAHLDAVKRERGQWEPARDAALAAAAAASRGARAGALASSPPRATLDAALSGRLLGGTAAAADVASIRRLTKSSIWLFSSSTFRVSCYPIYR